MRLNKYERIKIVRDLGLNTEENVLINPGDDIEKYKDFLKQHKEFSLRTFGYKDKTLFDISSPHFPIIEKKNLKRKIRQLHNQGYSCILATPINPRDAEFAGCARKLEDRFWIELALGAYTVRRITNEGKVDKFYDVAFREKTDDERVNRCLAEFRKVDLTNIIFEFSWYKIPVGWKQQQFICWEITSDGTPDKNLNLSLKNE